MAYSIKITKTTYNGLAALRAERIAADGSVEKWIEDYADQAADDCGRLMAVVPYGDKACSFHEVHSSVSFGASKSAEAQMKKVIKSLI